MTASVAPTTLTASFGQTWKRQFLPRNDPVTVVLANLPGSFGRPCEMARGAPFPMTSRALRLRGHLGRRRIKKERKRKMNREIRYCSSRFFAATTLGKRFASLALAVSARFARSVRVLRVRLLDSAPGAPAE